MAPRLAERAAAAIMIAQPRVIFRAAARAAVAASRNRRIAFAATPVPPAAFCAADDSRVIPTPPRAAAGS